MNRRAFAHGIAGGAIALTVLAAGLGPARASAEGPDGAMTVFKSPYCGCCAAWVDHVRAAGFPVTVKETEDLAPLKAMAGIPADGQSCHTALVGGYVVEGHVPADAIRRLLDEAPAIRGLAVPGMPVGSPGMEGPDPVPYTVWTIEDGRLGEAFARVSP
ncbi:MAG: DUF411 domain-containing protein [Azospirillaceae bacterium]